MKNKFNIVLLGTVLTIVAFSSGCKKSVFNINDNPNQPTDGTISYDVVLPAAMKNTGSVVAQQWGFLQNWMGYWARSGSYSANSVEESYQITTGFATGIWTSLYDNLYDYNVVETKGKAAGADFYVGIAKVMKAHNYQILVDFYNNVPYSQALKGTGNITPAYDNGLTVYKDLLRQLDTAITLIKNASESTTGPNKNIPSDDIMFGTKRFSGTTIAAMKPRWVRFANTLKLRILVHMMGNGIYSAATTVSGVDFTGEFAKIAATGAGFLLAGENASVNPGYAKDNGKQNPFYDLYIADYTGTATGSNRYYRANDYGIGYYDWNSDPRETRFYAAGSNGYVGVAYGLPPSTDYSYDKLAGVGPGVANAPTQDQWILTSSEGFFLQAEARHRGFLTGSADAANQTAISESFTLVGAGSAAAYIAGTATWPDVSYTAGGLGAIIQQKWFALNGIAPFEVYTDWRRTNYKYGLDGGWTQGPPLSVSPSRGSNQIPTRLLYPQTEYNYNPANVAAQGTITPQSKIFWDN